MANHLPERGGIVRAAMRTMWAGLLVLLSSAWPAVEVTASASDAPLCSEASPGEPCRIAVGNMAGCFLLRLGGAAQEIPLHWNGFCRGGMVDGQGTLTETNGARHAGTMISGVRRGVWRESYPGDIVALGEYLNGLRHSGWTYERRDRSGLWVVFEDGRPVAGALFENFDNPDGWFALREYKGDEGGAGGAKECIPSQDGRCWRPISGRPGCYVFGTRADNDTGPLTWSGRCPGGLAHGEGVLGNGADERHGGTLDLGVREGSWEEHFADGRIETGPYLHGDRHGPWTVSSSEGIAIAAVYTSGQLTDPWTSAHPLCSEASPGERCRVPLENPAGCHVLLIDPVDTEKRYTWSGACRHGLAHGQGVISNSEDYTASGRFVDGRRQGLWEGRFTDGLVQTGTYVEGFREGEWTFRFPDGTVKSATYTNGLLHGPVIERYPDGRVSEVAYVNGRIQQPLKQSWPDGRVETGPWIDRKREGQWEIRWPDGYAETVAYRRGKRHGPRTIAWPNGTSAVFHYRDGVLDGAAVIHGPDGSESTQRYRDGRRVDGDIDPPLPGFPPPEPP